MMAALGSDVSIVPTHGQGITESLVQEMIEEAERISAHPSHWWCDQLNNADTVLGHIPLGEEIWQQSEGSVEAFVQAVGTAHSLHGTTLGLRRHDPNAHVVAVESAESAVLSGGASGSHGIEGISVGFIPPLWEPDQVNELMKVSTSQAEAMARRLAREEGIFAGTSTSMGRSLGKEPIF